MASEVLTAKMNEFCFKLFTTLSQNKNENFFISPLSISTALTMAFAGSGSETAEQLKTVLSLNDLTNEQIFDLNREYLTLLEKGLGEGVALKLANKLFQNRNYQLLEKFTSDLQTHFKADSQALNFSESEASANEINGWVEDKTEKKIQNLIPADLLNDMTKLVLVNAIYFKGSWNFPFKTEDTEKEDFFLKDGTTTVKVDMMKLTSKKFHHKMNPADLKACTAEFPYTGKSTAMTIILPHEGVNIEEVESKINAETLKEIFHHNPMPGPVPIHAYIPKFKMEYKNELSDCLQKLGATHAFDEDLADFSLISSDSKGLYISKVIHQAVIEVNEEGAEAAAATAVVMMKRCMMPLNFPPEEFKCNRPFIFVIHETKTNGVLFMGKFMSPSAN